MPYMVRFLKPVEISDADQSINDCCVGGDRVLERLLPRLRERYRDIESNQEDWGWFAWFADAHVKLAVDAHTHDAKTGEFEVHLTSLKPRLLLGDKRADTPELERLRELVVSELRSWDVAGLEVERVNET